MYCLLLDGWTSGVFGRVVDVQDLPGEVKLAWDLL